MKLNLSAFLQWRFNIFMCRMIGWRITFFYIRMLGKLYFFFNPKEKWKIRKAVKTVFSDHKYRPEIRSISKKVFEGHSLIILKNFSTPIPLPEPCEVSS